MSHKDEIAVIGIGCRFPGANNPNKLWENVLARKAQFRRFVASRLPADDYCSETDIDGIYSTQAAYIDGFDFDWARHRIPKQVFESTDVAQWLALDVTLQALENTNIELDGELRDRTGVFMGNTLTGEQSRSAILRGRWPYVRKALHAAMGALKASPEQIEALGATMEPVFKSAFPAPNEDTLQGGLANTIAGRICNYLDLHGGGYVVDGACASSLLAVITAANHLVAGDVDFAIAGGVDISLDPMELVGFSRAGALSRGSMRVYDRRADGFIPGEGAGVILLKRLEDARRDKDRVYAVLRGWGVSSDGKGGMTAPSSSGQARAIIRACERAGLRPQDLDFVEGHGTGTRVGDETELRGLEAAFAHFGEYTQRCGITSLKSLVGHMKAAAGAGGLIKTIIALNQRVLPPTAGVDHPHAIFDTAPLYPIRDPQVRAPSDTLRAGVSAMGFGGINTHLIVESADPPIAELKPESPIERLCASPQACELFCLADDTLEGLCASLSRLEHAVRGISQSELASLAKRENPQERTTRGLRVAILAGTPASVVTTIGLVLERLAVPLGVGEQVVAKDRSFFIGHRLPDPSIGFVFPGQGSQSANSARNIVRRYDWASQHYMHFVTAMRDAGHLDIAEHMYPGDDAYLRADDKARVDERLRDTRIAQPLLCFSSLLYAELFERIGIQPDHIAGHSLGEFTALHAAGCMSAESLVELAIARGRAVGDQPAQGTMASLACDASIAHELIGASSHEVEVANLNARDQTVVSGTDAGVAQVLVRAEQRGVGARRLNVSHAFHSRLMEPAAQALEHTPIASLKMDGPRCVVLSGIDGRPFDPSNDLLAHMKTQLRAPVDFVAVANVLAHECDVVIELGPRRVLTTLLNKEADRDNFCIAVESSGDDWRGVNEAIAKLFVWGKSIDWDVVYGGRDIAAFTPTAQHVFITNPCERALVVPEPSTAPSPFAPPDTQAPGEHNGLSAEHLLGYLKTRGKFILNVIEADLEAGVDSGLESIPALAAQQPALVHRSPELAAQTAAPTATAAELGPGPQLHARFVALLAAKTGFEPESIGPEARLLDELNLDSIKSGEVLLDLVRLAGLEGKLAYEAFTNASVAEIIAHVEAAMHTSPQVALRALPGLLDTFVDILAKKTGFDASTITAQARLLDDLNLDSIKAGEVLLELVRVAGVEGKLSYEAFTNAPVHEIVERVEQARATSTPDSSAPAHGLDSRKERWIRPFELELVPIEVAPPSPANPTPSAELTILSTPRYAALVASFDRLPHAFSKVQHLDPERSEQLRCGPAQHVLVTVPDLAVLSWHDRVVWLERVVGATLRSGARTITFVTDNGLYGLCATPKDSGNSAGVGLASMLSSLKEEHPEIRFGLVDLQPEHAGHAAAQSITNLLLSDTPLFFASLGADGVEVFAPRLHAVTTALGNALLKSTPDDVWLVTGGAKGITLACALAVAQAHHGRFALVGSSPEPGLSVPTGPIQQGLERFKELGIEAAYFSCDVTDAAAVDRLVERVGSRLGPVRHIIHGAGRNRARRMTQVDAAQAWDEIATKIAGLDNLLAAIDPSSLRSVVGISSIIGVTGMHGNAWYALSNEALDAKIRALGETYPQLLARTVAFSVWGETGMGSDAGTLSRLDSLGVTPIPTAIGQAYFLRAYGPLGTQSRLIVTGSMRSLTGWGTLRPAGLDSTSIAADLQHPGVEAIARVSLHVSRDAYLLEHDFEGTLLLPTVFGLEQMAAVAAATLGTDDGVREILDVSLTRPITVNREESRKTRIHALVRDPGEDGLRIVDAGIYTAAHAEPHFQATFVFGPARANEVEPLVSLTSLAPLEISPRQDLYGDLLFQGESFQRMGPVLELSADRVVFEVEPSATQHDGMLGDPYVRDVQLQAAQLPLAPDLYLPISIARIERFEAAGSGRQFVTAVITAREGDEVEADVTRQLEDGTVLERLHGYRARLVRRRPDRPGVNDYLEPTAYNTRAFKQTLGHAFAELPLTQPDLWLLRDPTMSALERSARHLRQQEQLGPLLAETGAHGYALAWDEQGAPRLDGSGQPRTLSISHDEDFVLYASGAAPVGCDIELVTPRRFSQWQFLLGEHHAVLFNRIFSIGDSIDVSGYRVWSALEVVEKLGGTRSAVELDLFRHCGEVMSFHARALDAMIFTFPFRPLGGAQRMVAVGVTGVTNAFTKKSSPRIARPAQAEAR